MKKGTLRNNSRGDVIARRVHRCQGLFDRMKGLIGTKTMAEDEACWLIPCNSVHTFGMSFDIDVYFLSKDNRVLSMFEGMKPNSLSPLIWNAHSVLEMKSGASRNILPGDQLSWDEAA